LQPQHSHLHPDAQAHFPAAQVHPQPPSLHEYGQVHAPVTQQQVVILEMKWMMSRQRDWRAVEAMVRLKFCGSKLASLFRLVRLFIMR
jgi:hypothetical protein